MGVYGCMKFAHLNGLVRSQATCMAKGVMIPVAVDLWNVMYGLMEKFYPKREQGDDDSVSTLRCLFSLLRLLQRRTYFPIFVFDGGIHGEVRAAVGAKAIVAETCPWTGPYAVPAGSGRIVPSAAFSEDEGLGFPEGEEGSFCYDRGEDARDGEPGARSSIPDRAATRSGGTEPGKRVERGRGTPESVRAAEEWYHDGGDSPTAASRKTRSSQTRWSAKPETPRVVHKLCVGMLRHLGYAYVEAADSEADDICANLYHTKAVSYVVSSDTDLLLMGCDIIVDMTHLFPSVIRCRDVLASLGIDYPTFLVKFVRCHTDLHREPVLKSMQEVIAEDEMPLAWPPDAESAADSHRPAALSASAAVGRKRTAPGEERSAKEDEDGFVVVKSRGRKNRRVRDPEGSPEEPSAPSSPPAKSGRQRSVYEGYLSHGEWSPSPSPRRPFLARDNAGGEDDAQTAAAPVEKARLALQRLPPAKTLCEVLERKFIKHVVALLTPEQRTARVSILKRAPIAQEGRNELAVHELIRGYISDARTAESLIRSVGKKAPRIPFYGKALAAYWDC